MALGINSQNLESFRLTSPGNSFLDKLILNRVQTFFDKRATFETLLNRAVAEFSTATTDAVRNSIGDSKNLEQWTPAEAQDILDETNACANRFKANMKTGARKSSEVIDLLVASATHFRSKNSLLPEEKLFYDHQTTEGQLITDIQTLARLGDAATTSPNKIKSMNWLFAKKMISEGKLPLLQKLAQEGGATGNNFALDGTYSPSVLRAVEAQLTDSSTPSDISHLLNLRQRSLK